jgi:hypothetical protein
VRALTGATAIKVAVAVALALVALAVTVAIVVPSADDGDDELQSKLAAARAFRGYPLYWVGQRFEGFDLRYVDVPGRYGFATLIYGECDVEDPDGLLGPEGGSCTPPLQIQIAPLCFHLDVVARAPTWRRRSVRGAPVGSNPDGAPILFTRGAHIKVYRGDGSTLGLAFRALRAIRSLNSVPPVVAPADPIPAPDPRVLAGSAACSDTRGGAALIDENRGTYRGVGIGASATAVRRVLGPRRFARQDEPPTPRNATSISAIGGPSALMRPCHPTAAGKGAASRARVLRYPEVSFLFCDNRVLALVVSDPQARTQAGLAIGDQLAQAQRLYPGLRCGRASSGDAGGYPFCVGRLRPQRSLWFGHDPIGSITISATRFGVPGER